MCLPQVKNGYNTKDDHFSSRVREPNNSDWEKGCRLVRYLRFAQNVYLFLWYDGLNICKWHVDSSFAVHSDAKSHPGEVILCFRLVEV